jgi:type II restriction/modification system DNA methylase subunit YeeA
VVIGNPPFLGGKLLRTVLSSKYVDRLFKAYAGRVPAEADLVTYWFSKAWELMRGGQLNRVGLVATNSIRGGANRRVIEPIKNDGIIFDAWDDEAWVVDGAAVRVSIICFVPAGNASVATLNGLARKWLALPLNPNGLGNANILRPWMNGMDVTRRSAGKWIVDFGWRMDEEEAALFETPFNHIHEKVKPERETNNREAYRRFWWRHVEPRQGMWAALAGQPRYIVTPTVAKHRLFAWLQVSVCPDHQLIAIARGDDTTFGILHSRFHEAWSLGLCTWLGVGNDPRYTPSTTFETFPFPEGLAPNIPASAYASDARAVKIADAAKRLNDLRELWLNPPDLVKRVPEVMPGFPERILPVDDKAAVILNKRTLTNLYNEQPAWLTHAHRDLDNAVAAAYAWPADISEDDALARLFALNRSRAQAADQRRARPS